MELANIVFEKELINHIKVDYVNYYNQLIDYDSLDKSLPTLFVGWSFMKKCSSNNEVIQNANILSKKIVSNELYWEMSYEESKQSHVKGVETFIKNIPQYYFVPKYNYINLCPIFFNLSNIDDLMDVVPKKIDSMYIHKNEMIYIQYQNKITGINLSQYNFFKFDTNQIKTLLTERTSQIFDDVYGELYKTQYKIFPEFPYLKRFMVPLLTN